MLQLSSALMQKPILSLRTGSPIGFAYTMIINPSNFKIEGWHASARGERDEKVLPASEVRDISKRGYIVNDYDAITDRDDLVRMQRTLRIDYQVIGKKVKTESKKTLGKVSDFAVDTDTMSIRKLYITQSLLRGINAKDLQIDRSQITEVTDSVIIVKDSTERVRTRVPAQQTA